MNKKPLQLLFFAACAIVTLVIVIVSCNKKFDAPPNYIPPNIAVTNSIASLKAMHVSGRVDSITADMVIGGIVIANDSSGNFYKQIVLQDSTGGIAVSIDDYNLYATFPIGRKVYVKLKGLFMSENSGLIYIGGSPDNGGSVAGIASRLKDQFLVKGEINVPVAPTVVSITDLKNNPTKYMYTLVQFNNFEVKDSDTSKTYAYSTPTSKTDANIVVKGCGASDTMTIRTSGYSYFANVFVPKGNGTLTAVYAYYKSPYNGRITPQLIIRDTSDVQFKGTRCNGTEPPPPSNASLISIKSLRALYQNGGIVLGRYKIAGVVISDAANKNISSGSFVLQDGDRGISVYYGGTISYAVGNSVVIDVTGDSLLSYRGSLQVKVNARGVTPPSPVASNKTVTPVDITVSQLNGSLSDIEFTLVKIKSATASGTTGTFSGNQTLTDASGNMALYTSSSAMFASTALPSGAKDWVGYGSFFNTTKQFQIRNLGGISDATGGGTTPPPSGGSDISLTASPYTIDFNSIGGGLPTGVYVQTGAKSTAAGINAAYTTSQALWKTTTGGFKNFASATGLSEGSDSSAQIASTNRALGVRQTSSTDPGIAFVFALNNTAGKSALGISFQLQSLDTSSPRTTTWIVDYGIGDNPSSFTQASTGTIITGNHAFSNNTVNVSFGSALDNQSGKVWIRVTTLSASTGSGNRASTAVDDVSITFN